jgi:hypothetical protein
MMGRATAMVNAVLLSSAPVGQIVVGLLMAPADYSKVFLIEGLFTAVLLVFTALRNRTKREAALSKT